MDKARAYGFKRVQCEQLYASRFDLVPRNQVNYREYFLFPFVLFLCSLPSQPSATLGAAGTKPDREKALLPDRTPEVAARVNNSPIIHHSLLVVSFKLSMKPSRLDWLGGWYNWMRTIRRVQSSNVSCLHHACPFRHHTKSAVT